MARIIECVPNFSEGRNKAVIEEIAGAIACTQVGGQKVKVLNIDPGEAANRTVITFIGSPEAVCEAAFQGARKAAEKIDMRVHQGTHPRSGATDVLPLIPVSEVSLEECAAMARALSKRMYEELGIPCYCYEAAALKPKRKNLAVCRAGGYEALPEKIANPERRPDFGPQSFNETVARTGASNVGARNFLIAVNFNLNTTSKEIAGEIACDVREKGRKSNTGQWIPGTLPGCKAIGWFIEEYGIAQVSMNITDIQTTPLHIAFEEVCRAAEARGAEVTGTEIIGLVPQSVLTDAGIYFLKKMGVSNFHSEEEQIRTAIEKMGLDDLRPFNPDKKILERLM